MKKLATLILFVVCVFATTHKSFAQSESVQDKLMKYKWVMDNGEDGPSPVGYTTYTKTSSIYNMDDIGRDPSISPYYLSRNIQSLSFKKSRIGKNKNGIYMYRQTGLRKELYIFKILTLTDYKLELQLIVPDPITIIGPPSIRTYKAYPL